MLAFKIIFLRGLFLGKCKKRLFSCKKRKSLFGGKGFFIHLKRIDKTAERLGERSSQMSAIGLCNTFLKEILNFNSSFAGSSVHGYPFVSH